MSEREKTAPQGAAEGEATQGTPQGEGAPEGERPPSYRKMEEDSTELNESERTGEGTGARAGEYS